MVLLLLLLLAVRRPQRRAVANLLHANGHVLHVWVDNVSVRQEGPHVDRREDGDLDLEVAELLQARHVVQRVALGVLPDGDRLEGVDVDGLLIVDAAVVLVLQDAVLVLLDAQHRQFVLALQLEQLLIALDELGDEVLLDLLGGPRVRLGLGLLLCLNLFRRRLLGREARLLRGEILRGVGVVVGGAAADVAAGTEGGGGGAGGGRVAVSGGGLAVLARDVLVTEAELRQDAARCGEAADKHCCF